MVISLARGAAGGLCLLALPLPRRQAPVLLAADQPHGAAGAVFALPFFQLYSAFGLFDTHIAVALAHCLFNVPLAIWILEGFMSGVPKEIDETAYIDGYLPALLHQDLHAADRVPASACRLLLLHVLVGGTAASPAR
jgi:ABC-type spermidine/putrescine transport system permease subunit II